jgi:acyl-coenzyme A synthetase/AMP-(fatty) acid ligase
MNDWFEHILFNAATQPETPAVVMEDRAVTYGMLRAAIERTAVRIVALGLVNDAVVAIVVGNPIRHLVLALALYRLGRVSISLEPGQFALAEVAFGAVLGDSAAASVVSSPHRLVLVADDWFGADLVTGISLPVGFSDGRNTCRMSLTSGSTGKPKIITFSIDEIGSRMNGLMRLHWSRLLCLPGLSTSWGFWTACATLAFGGTLFFSASPFQSVRMVELFGIDYVMAATEQLLALARAARKTGATMRSIRLVEVAGAPPTQVLLQNAVAYVCREIYCRYGASEAGAIARTHARDVLATPGFAGHVLPGVELEVVDAKGHALPVGAVGAVRIRPKARGDGSSARSGWIDLGDLGFFGPDGALHILGRTSDEDLSKGSSLPQADRQVLQLSMVQEAEHLLRLEWDATDAAAVLIETEPGRPQRIGFGTVDCKGVDTQALQALLLARGISCEVELFAIPFIPRSVNGKINRTQLRSMILAMRGRSRS